MKKILLVLALSFLGQDAMAATCKATVEDAALRFAAQADASSADGLTVAGSKFVRANGASRHYVVEIFEQIAGDGITEDLPSQYYLVTAVGTQYGCNVRSVKAK